MQTNPLQLQIFRPAGPSPVVLGVDAAEGDAVDGVMPPEEHPETDAGVKKSRGATGFLNGSGVVPALAVCQRDALRRHLKLDHGGGRTRVSAEGGLRCLGDGLGAGQGLCFHRVQVEDVAG